MSTYRRWAPEEDKQLREMVEAGKSVTMHLEDRPHGWRRNQRCAAGDRCQRMSTPSSTFDVIKDVVLFGLAIYGAGLSTWNLVQASRRERRKLTVTTETQTPTFAGGNLGKPWANLKATNVGARSVTVTGLTFSVEGDGKLVNLASSPPHGMTETTLPVALSDGQTANRLMSYFDIGHALIASGRPSKTRLIPIAEDSAGGSHVGDPWEVDPHDFIRR